MLFALLIAGFGQGQEVSVASMLPEMTDLEGLAHVPAPFYVTRQASSYDRASVSPDKDWFANADYGQYIRKETVEGHDEYVMADLLGPGAVVRFWSANPAGTARFYFDGEAKPSLSAKLGDLLTGKVEPFSDPIACARSMGTNLYFPMPYAKGLKITLEASEQAAKGVYYQIMYRTYDLAAQVKSFTLDQAKEALNGNARARTIAAARFGSVNPGHPITSMTRTVAPGKTLELFSSSRRGEVDLLEIKLGNSSPENLRGCILEGTFDGKKTVAAPLGDFFGAAPGINRYDSLPVSVAADGTMTSRWAMPFETGATLQLRNLTKSAIQVTATVGNRTLTAVKNPLLFHAKWRMEKMFTRPMRDWNILNVPSGTGRFVGVSLAVANPTKAWWGEGDEKIYIDGETFPSTFGTGTEDYFGYAWCCPEVFSHPYHNQPRCDGPANKGNTSVNRWHILDGMPFSKSFKFDMELWHWAEVDVTYAATAYWYASPESTDTFKPIDAKDLVLPVIPVAVRVKGAIEGEELKAKVTGGVTELQGYENLSNETQLWWRDAAVGDKLTATITVPSTGMYEITGKFCTAGDYGIHQISLNGKPLGGPIDFYNKDLKWKAIGFGAIILPAGEVKLEVMVTGANPQAIQRHMFGLDYLLLTPKN